MTTRRVTFLTLTIPVALLSSGERAAEAFSSSRAWLSDVLAYDASACTVECSKCGAGAWKHETEFAINGEYAGGIHSCHDYHPGCADWHECSEIMTASEREELVRAIRGIRAVELVAVDSDEPNLMINYDRHTPHILGCDGVVVVSVAWTPPQELEFAELAGGLS